MPRAEFWAATKVLQAVEAPTSVDEIVIHASYVVKGVEEERLEMHAVNSVHAVCMAPLPSALMTFMGEMASWWLEAARWASCWLEAAKRLQ